MRFTLVSLMSLCLATSVLSQPILAVRAEASTEISQEQQQHSEPDGHQIAEGWKRAEEASSSSDSHAEPDGHQIAEGWKRDESAPTSVAVSSSDSTSAHFEPEASQIAEGW